MAFNKFIEDQIQKAMSAGFFDNLKGAGKPLNLDDYFNTPEDVRLGYSILKNGDFIPPEVQILREIGESKNQLAASADEGERRRLRKLIEEKMLGYNLTVERYRKKR